MEELIRKIEQFIHDRELDYEDTGRLDSKHEYLIAYALKYAVYELHEVSQKDDWIKDIETILEEVE